MTDPIDTAFVEVAPDTRRFTADLKRQLDAAFARLNAQVDRTTADMSRTFRRAGDNIGDHIRSGARAGERAIDDLADDAVRDLGRIQRQARETSRSLAAMVGTRLVAGLTEVLNALGSATISGAKGAAGALAGLAATVASGLPGLIVTAAAIVALTTVLAGLAAVAVTVTAALSSLAALVTLIPAGLALIAGAVAPLIIAFKGLGGAIETAFERDPKKFREALKGLTPPAQRLAKILRGFLPIFDRIRLHVETAFLTPITRQLAPTLQRLLPVLDKGFTQVAGAAGRFVASILTVLTSPQFTRLLSGLFPTIARTIDAFAPVAGRLLKSFADIASATLPIIARLLGGLGGALTTFSNFIDQSINSGAFRKWLDEGLTVAGMIKDLLRAALDFVAVLFGPENRQAGRDMLRDITGFVQRMTDFFRSPEGRQFLADLRELARRFMLALEMSLPVIARLAKAALAIANAVSAAIIGVNILIDRIRVATGAASTLASRLGAAAAAAARAGADATSGTSGFGHRAHGGPVLAGHPYLVGERGPELFVPDVSGQIAATKAQLHRILSGAGQPAPAVTSGPAIDEERLAALIARKLVRGMNGMEWRFVDVDRVVSRAVGYRADLQRRGG